LLELRKRNDALKNSLESFPIFIPGAEEKNMLAFYRASKEHTVLVFINMSKEQQSLSFDTSNLQGNYINVFTGENVWLNKGGQVTLDAAGFVLLEKI
jgi:hypothetical protein